VQRIRDVPFDGLVTVWWVKKRWRCVEALCGRATFTEHTDQVPPYARLTTRLKERIVTAYALASPTQMSRFRLSGRPVMRA